MSDNITQPVELQATNTGHDRAAELEAFNQIVSAIQRLPDQNAQMRVVKSALTFLGWAEPVPLKRQGNSAEESKGPSFSQDRNLSPKEFLFEKKPHTDIERVACLAYYLTHYRSTPHFKTLDISKLNTEAAQIKLSNAAGAVENATAAGLLVAAGKGNKQLSAGGELYVQALPDREAAKSAMAHIKPRRKSKRTEETNNGDEGETR